MERSAAVLSPQEIKKKNMACLGKIQFQDVKSSFSCSWTLQKTLSILEKGPSKYYSEVFHLTPHHFQWEMCFHKWGIETAVDFNLLCKPSDTKTPITLVRVTASIRGSDGKVLTRACDDERQEVPYVSDDPVISLRIRLLEFNRNVMIDMLVIDLEVSYEYANATSGKLNTSDDLVCNKAKLIQEFVGLYQTGTMADAVVVVEGREIKVHSLVLTARSKVLAAMFESSFLEGQTRRIEITDFSSDTIDCMMKFLYGASVHDLDVDKALELLRAADKYDIPDLTNSCYKFFLGHMNEKTVIPILVSADMFSIADLKKKALDYLIKNRSSISVDDHKSLLDTRPSVLYEITNRLLKI